MFVSAGHWGGVIVAQHFAAFLVFAIMVPLQYLALDEKWIERAAKSQREPMGAPHLKRAMMIVSIFGLVWHGALWTGAAAFAALVMAMAYSARVNALVRERDGGSWRVEPKPEARDGPL